MKENKPEENQENHEKFDLIFELFDDEEEAEELDAQIREIIASIELPGNMLEFFIEGMKEEINQLDVAIKNNRLEHHLIIFTNAVAIFANLNSTSTIGRFTSLIISLLLISRLFNVRQKEIKNRIELEGLIQAGKIIEQDFVRTRA